MRGQEAGRGGAEGEGQGDGKGGEPSQTRKEQVRLSKERIKYYIENMGFGRKDAILI